MKNNRLFKIRLIFVLILMNSSIKLFSQEMQIKFHHLTSDDGLSQNAILSIFQDSKGFLWFGTESGLNRYDGYNFIVYGPVKDDPYSLSNNWICSIFEDHTGILWIGTENGLNAFDRKTERFTQYLHDPNNAQSISNNRIFTIYEDSSNILWIGTDNGLNKLIRSKNEGSVPTFVRYKNDKSDSNSLSNNSVRSIVHSQSGKLWIGTNGGGLDLLDPANDLFIHYTNIPGDHNSLSDNQVLALYEDKKGILWIGTQNGGMNRFDYKNNIFTHYVNSPNNQNSISDNWVNCIYEDRSGHLWIATMAGGLNRFNRKENRFLNFRYNSNNPFGISSNRINSLFEDNSGVLWIGMYGGLNKYTKEANSFLHFRSNSHDANSLSHKFVRSFYYNSSDILWVGTEGGGLDKFDQKNQKVTHYRNDPKNPNSLSHNWVFSIAEEDVNRYWIGTYGGGLNQFNPVINRFKQFRHNAEDIKSLSDDRIRFILPDLPNTLWIGTDGGGLNKFDINTRTFTHFKNDPNNINSLSNDRIIYILKDRMSNILWICTFGGGLDRFDPATGQFINYKANLQNMNSLPNDYVLTICQDNSGILWIGTNGGGLTKFDPKKETFITYTEKDGLSNNTIYGILMDKAGNLWMSSNKGISKFYPAKEIFKKYDASDGLQSDEFNGGAYYKSKSGRLYFGGIAGFNSFDPEDITDNQFMPPIVITDLKVLNKSVPIGKPEDNNSILSCSINLTNEIELTYRENVFSFEFSALHYVYPNKNKYAYKLDGFDKDWIHVNSDKRSVSYMNLTPGNYTFRVRGSNNSGLWNEEGASLRIKIIPPFWKTTWFRILSAILFIGVLVMFYWVRMHAIQERNKELELRVHERTAELEALNDELKDFAYIVSHDLKAPLRGVTQIASWMSHDYADVLDEEGKKQLSLLTGRVRRMDSLIDGVLRYSRAGRPDDEKEKIDLEKFLPEIIESLAAPPHIKIEVEEGMPTVYAHPTQTQQVFQNLISNAIKYNDKKEGLVRVGFSEEGGFWKFFISDNGPGIEKKYHEKIFQLFQTLESKDTNESTGVGLSVVKKIVERLGGKIWVESKKGKGSTFYFSLPKDESHFKE